MPMIELTAPEGALSPEGRKSVQQGLAGVLMHWEGAPDTAFFRSLTWTCLHELPAGAQTTAEDSAPRFRVEVTVPQGALSERRKAGLIADVTSTVLAAAGLGEAEALRVWVLIREQPEGTWGAGGSVVRFAELVALANEQREQTSGA
ncbi:4-oxalocrotonate tautomerase family protein [Streptomyces sp. NPDC057445]|uniref:tautomerase family protein n=1 Tax=Streptomyces sp. NPDC057445 TaxID=3346136 RepID=UPI0036AC5BBA